MPSLYTENSEKWKSLASIDYLTQFIKAWIPLNAWYKNYYPLLEKDREAINEIKAHSNNFRNNLISLLKNQSNDGIAFKSRISELHWQLERKHIFNKGKRITFEEIVIQTNPNKQHSFQHKNLTYKVEREITNRPKKEVHIYIINKSGSNKFSYIQPDGFDIDGLVSHQDFLKLTENQQINIRTCYEEINPSKPINLLIQDPKILQDIQDPIKRQKISDKYIQIGNFYFINDTDKLCKGIIEILYKLRNVLFHGEIVPDNDTNKVYEPAYHILHTLIQAL